MTKLHEIKDYYDSRISEHGASPKGVDWNGHAGQTIRFDQLMQVCSGSSSFSLNDLGCGYGALLDYLKDRKKAVDYAGYDISASMIDTALERFQNSNDVVFGLKAEPDRIADFTVASGIFNVRLENDDASWLNYIHETLEKMDRSSRLGFSFNCLTKYSDSEKMRDYLYYADPVSLFDHCKRKFSRNVALLHDYDLYEFTIIVRKDQEITA